jgi:hypothetical protein
VKTLRTENWTKDFHGMTNTLVLDVLEGEVVHMDPVFKDEFKVDPAASKEVVPEFSQHFVWEFPYSVFSGYLQQAGWGHASTT